MTEGQFNAKLVKELRKRLGPDAVVFKHADSYTAGMPDISASKNGHTVWIECKLTTNRKLYEPLQYEILKKLYGLYVIWDAEQGYGYVHYAISKESEKPRKTFKDLVQTIVEEVENGWK